MARKRKRATRPRSEPADFDGPEPTEDIKTKARELMIGHRGYADRQDRTANVDRLLWRNFGQGSAPKDPKNYWDNFEKIFGKRKTKPDYGKREGYSVKPYRPTVAHEIDPLMVMRERDMEEAERDEVVE